jgi:hypothetical protein
MYRKFASTIFGASIPLLKLFEESSGKEPIEHIWEFNLPQAGKLAWWRPNASMAGMPATSSAFLSLPTGVLHRFLSVGSNRLWPGCRRTSEQTR